MAEYLVLIYGDESASGGADAEASNQVMKGHQVFGERNAAALRGGNALQPTASATSIREDSAGGFVVTDGPFAETKEHLAGFYLIDARDFNEAIQMAAQIPPARVGSIEVRPVRDLTSTSGERRQV